MSRRKATEAPVDVGSYVTRAKEYARVASLDANSSRFNKWTRLAARRFLGDLKRTDKLFKFEEWHVNDVCSFIEKLPHVEGTWETRDIRLHDSDVFFLANLFGFRKADGTRRYTQALKCIARKNAKSSIAACIGLYCQVCEREVGPQVVTAATTGAQARIVFNIAKRMADRTSDLREAFALEPFVHSIACYSNGGTFKPINAKASTQDGLNPSCTILDEIHAHKSHDLLNVLRSAAGARANPLFLFTTTEGFENEGPWPELRQFAEQVLEGVVEADHFFAVIYSVDDADDDFDESCWVKANPLMEVNPLLLQELRKEAIEAKQMPGRHAEFKTKRLNRREAAQGRWVDLMKWRQCAGPVDLNWLKDYPCFGGLDLASVSDLAAFRLVWLVEGRWYTHGFRFVPHVSVKRRSQRGLVPFAQWLNSKHLIEAGDDVTDFQVIRGVINQAAETYDLRGVAYDTWNASQLAKQLEGDGVVMLPFIQGPKSYHPAMKELERAYTAGKLNHGNDPVLNWCISNLVARVDANMNQAPDKKRAVEKIDDACALLMAIGATLGDAGDDDEILEALRAPVVA